MLRENLKQTLSTAGALGLLAFSAGAQVNIVGTGCPGFSGTVPTLSSPDTPVLGGSINLNVSGTPSTPGLMIFGISNTVWSGLSLPLDLSLFALPGCTLYNSFDISIGINTDANGDWSAALPIAPSGATMYMQTYLLDFSFPVNYGAVSNGIEVKPITPGQGGIGDVVIVEIMVNPAAVGDNTGEYIELFNTTDQVIDLEGWRLLDTFIDLEFLVNGGNGLLIQPGGRFVIAGSKDAYVNGGITVDYEMSNFQLDNGTDEIILQDQNFKNHDRVDYANGWPKGPGVAMQYNQNIGTPAFSNNDPANWCKAVSAIPSGDLGTPGAVNDPCP